MGYVQKYKLDGVVFDWEGQRDANAEIAYGKMLGTIRLNLRKLNPEVTPAPPPATNTPTRALLPG